MNQFLTVFRFTYADAVRKKAFLISTGIILVLILGACLAARFLGDAGEGAQTESTETAEFAQNAGEIAYLDEAGLIPGGPDALGQMGYRVSAIAPAEEDAARERVRQNGDLALVRVEPGEGQPFVRVVTKDFMAGIDAETIARALTLAWSREKLAALNVSGEALALATAAPRYSAETAGTMQVTGYTLGIVISMLMFFAVYFYGLSVANSVSMEKTSRVMETLVVSAKPRNILAGKCAAMGAAGLTQMGALILFSVACFKLIVPAGTSLFGLALTFDGVTPGLGLLMVAYFLLGYALYAMMNAVCGASVSRIEDVSSALMPVSMVGMVSFYIGYFTSLMGSGEGLMNKIAMYVPFCSPFAMPFRILSGSAGALDVAISLALLIVAIVAVTAISVRLYAAGVMYYGKRLKIKDMIKMKP